MLLLALRVNPCDPESVEWNFADAAVASLQLAYLLLAHIIVVSLDIINHQTEVRSFSSLQVKEFIVVLKRMEKCKKNSIRST